MLLPRVWAGGCHPWASHFTARSPQLLARWAFYQTSELGLILQRRRSSNTPNASVYKNLSTHFREKRLHRQLVGISKALVSSAGLWQLTPDSIQTIGPDTEAREIRALVSQHCWKRHSNVRRNQPLLVNWKAICLFLLSFLFPYTGKALRKQSYKTEIFKRTFINL